MSKRDFAPIHPGEILLEEFLNPMGIFLIILSVIIVGLIPMAVITE